MWQNKTQEQQVSRIPRNGTDRVDWYQVPGQGPLEWPEGQPQESFRLAKGKEWFVRGSDEEHAVPIEECTKNCTGRGVCIRSKLGLKCVCRKVTSRPFRPLLLLSPSPPLSWARLPLPGLFDRCSCWPSPPTYPGLVSLPQGFRGQSCEEDDPDEACWFSPSCNGHGKCRSGFCHCDKGYWGFGCGRSKAYALAPASRAVPSRTKLRIYMYDLPSSVAFPGEYNDGAMSRDIIYTAYEFFITSFLKVGAWQRYMAEEYPLVYGGYTVIRR